MDEDEDVDIVGGLDNFISKNEREISNISSGQILSCEYTVHPRWLSDNNDGAENLWLQNLPKQSSQDEMELVQDEVVIEEPAPIDFDWAEEVEETSNCEDIIFEQDIPATLEEEVVIGSDETHEFDENENSDCCSRSSQENERMGDTTKCSTQLPDAYVPESNSLKHFNKTVAPKLNKIKRPTVKFKKTLLVSKNLLILNQRNFSVDPKAGTSLLKSEIREKSSDGNSSMETNIEKKSVSKFTVSLKKLKCPTRQKHGNTKSKVTGKSAESTSGKAKKFVDIHGENITINHEADECTQISTDDTSQTDSCSSVIKRKSNQDSDSDVEVDIESDTPNDLIESPDSNAIFSIVKTDSIESTECEKVPPLKIKALKKKEPEELKMNLKNLSTELFSQLNCLNEPAEELILPKQYCELEKYLHSEFFENRPTKTPLSPDLRFHYRLPNLRVLEWRAHNNESMNTSNISLPTLESLEISFEGVNLLRSINCNYLKSLNINCYEINDDHIGTICEFKTLSSLDTTLCSYMKIRDFILHVWAETKPTYLSKTTVRNGLKHCGDVNCISRIHCTLEQLGAINYGYAGEHFQYVRPLLKLKEHYMQSLQNKKTTPTGGYDVSSSLVLGRRPRNKSISVHSAERDIDANYTVSHVNGVPTLLYATVSKERESLRREASKSIKVELELIECLRFAKDKVPPFKVSMTLSTLLCLYLHALSSKFEVMGFLGGYCTKSVGRNKLSLTRYKPCKTAHQTGTTCEMCPVSQVEQAANLTNEGYELVGWFHSHPTFEANPSRTDVATQADMQLQFSTESDRPFIGFILNCIDMGYNCMYILPKDIHKDTIDIIPYGFEVDIIKDCSSLQNDIADVFNVIDRNSQNYVQTVEKFIKTGTELLRYHDFDLSIPDYLRSYL